MARVTVADDVLSGQPEAVHEIDYVKLVETGVEELHLEGWRGDVRFLITPPEPAVLAGVGAAVERLRLVDEFGAELPGPWAVGDNRMAEVEGPFRAPDGGIVLSAGTKDGVVVALARTLVRVLREELERLHLDTTLGCLPAEVALADLRPWTDAPPEPPEPAERFWYVQRPRTLTTTTGVPYFDITYLRPDQTWTYDPREALRLPQQERMRAFSIVQDFRAQGVAHSEGMYAVLLTVAEADVRHPMPPEEIRAPE